MERDPVCGMSVDPEEAKAKVEHGGKSYYFCCGGCAQKFQAAPEKYLAATSSAGDAAARPNVAQHVNRAPMKIAAAATPMQIAGTPLQIAGIGAKPPAM